MLDFYQVGYGSMLFFEVRIMTRIFFTDGSGPNFFWMVGSGDSSIRVRNPDGNARIPQIFKLYSRNQILVRTQFMSPH